ncbi:MAG: fasciclin domain-containing protein, partial [Sphingomonadaceae bacterium]
MKISFKAFSTGIFTAASAISLAACGAPADSVDDTAADAESVAEEPGTIVAVAQGDETFSTLVTAITAADLVETLASGGQFTVFA